VGKSSFPSRTFSTPTDVTTIVQGWLALRATISLLAGADGHLAGDSVHSTGRCVECGELIIEGAASDYATRCGCDSKEIGLHLRCPSALSLVLRARREIGSYSVPSETGLLAKGSSTSKVTE
jgi:hypothetical protein